MEDTHKLKQIILERPDSLKIEDWAVPKLQWKPEDRPSPSYCWNHKSLALTPRFEMPCLLKENPPLTRGKLAHASKHLEHAPSVWPAWQHTLISDAEPDRFLSTMEGSDGSRHFWCPETQKNPVSGNNSRITHTTISTLRKQCRNSSNKDKPTK